MTASRFGVCLFIGAWSLLVSAAWGQAVPPALVNYQGVLRDSQDAPLTGSYDMTFRLYSAATGGDEILVDAHTAATGTAIVVQGGLFAVRVGSGVVSDGAGPGTFSSLQEVFSAYGDVHLSLQIGTEVLSPRTRLVAAPYALNAGRLAGKSADTFADRSASNVFTAGEQRFTTGGAGARAVVISGAAGQTADLTVWTDSNGSVVASVAPSGTFSGNFDGVHFGSFNGDASGTFSGSAWGTFSGTIEGDGSGLTNLDPALTRDSEWNSAAKINAATQDEDFLTTGSDQSVGGDKTFSGSTTIARLNGTRHSPSFASVTAAVSDLPAGGGAVAVPTDEDDPTPSRDVNPELRADSLILDMRKGRFHAVSSAPEPGNDAAPDEVPFVFSVRRNAPLGRPWTCADTHVCPTSSNYDRLKYTGICPVNDPTWFNGGANSGSEMWACGGPPIFQVRQPELPAPGSLDQGNADPIFSVGGLGVSIFAPDDNGGQANYFTIYRPRSEPAKAGMPNFFNGGLGTFTDGGLFAGNVYQWHYPWSMNSYPSHIGWMQSDLAWKQPVLVIESATDTPTPQSIAPFVAYYDAQHGFFTSACNTSQSAPLVDGSRYADGLPSTVDHPCGELRYWHRSDGSQRTAGRWFDRLGTSESFGVRIEGTFRSAETSGAGPEFNAASLDAGAESAAAGTKIAGIRGVRARPRVFGAASGLFVGALSGLEGAPEVLSTGPGTTLDVVTGLKTGGTLGGSSYKINNLFGGYFGSWALGSMAGVQVDRAYGVFVGDQQGSILGGLENHAILVAAQSTGGSGSRGNVTLAGGNWNDGHLALGTRHLWIDGAGSLRMKNGAPVSDADGEEFLRSGGDQVIVGAKNFDNPGNVFTGDGTALSNVNAARLQGWPAAVFLRSDTSDVFESGTLTMWPGTTLDVQGTARLSGDLVMTGNGPDRDQSLWFFDNGTAGAERILWEDAVSRFSVSDDLFVQGDLSGSGAKSFVQNHPADPSREIVYTALEGDEAGTYTRGTARLAGGVARVRLGETFAWVTNPDVGITVHLTPRSPGASLWVESATAAELVVRAAEGSAPDALFDFMVMGLRLGFEERSPVRPRTADSRVPSPASYEAFYAARPELRSGNPASRFRAMERAAGLPSRDSGLAESLVAAIGAVDKPVAAAAPEPSAALPPAAASKAPATLPLQPWMRSSLVAESVRPSGGEIARYFPVSELVEPGDVLVSDPAEPGRLRRGDAAEDPGVAGIVSGQPGLSLGGGFVAMREVDSSLADRLESARDAGNRPEEARLWAELEKKFAEARAPVAQSGIVACKVDASYGPIARGDLLAVSPTPGHAMKSPSAAPGTVLGKALEPLAEGRGAIRVLVMWR